MISKKLFNLEIPHRLEIHNLTTAEIQCIKAQCNKALLEKAEAEEALYGDVGTDGSGNHHLYTGSSKGWQFLSGSASPSGAHITRTFNIPKLLLQGPIVVGLTAEEAQGIKGLTGCKWLYLRINDALNRYQGTRGERL